jgi:D-alanyl-D-alanine carboxypeptidase
MKKSLPFGKNLQLILLSVLFFVIAIIFLISTNAVVKLTESKVTFAGNEKLPLIQEVRKPRVEIIDSKLTQPGFTSAAVLAEDLDLEKFLYTKNITQRLSPASTTKIMTALIAVEHFQSGDILIVPPDALVGGSTMGLSAGESVSFRSLLYGMLLNSGNDAAYTIALNYPGGYNSFITAMNKKAQLLKLQNTHFENPAGFDSLNHYSSAYDLSQIAKEAIKNPQLSTIFSTKETQVTSIDNSKVHELKNLNKLLSEEGVVGIKTGFTEIAGENFVGLIEKNGHRILTVVLNSADRFGETKNLMEWVFANYYWKSDTADKYAINWGPSKT